jgi:hypothetical protein
MRLSPLLQVSMPLLLMKRQKLIHFESGHLHKWVFCCFRIALLALLVVWVVAQSPLPFT